MFIAGTAVTAFAHVPLGGLAQTVSKFSFLLQRRQKIVLSNLSQNLVPVHCTKHGLGNIGAACPSKPGFKIEMCQGVNQ